MNKAEARRLTDKATKDFWNFILAVARVRDEGGFRALGYSTFLEYREAEFPYLPQIGRDKRGEVFGQLAAAGQSNRAIAEITGVSRNTVNETEFVEPQDQQVAQIEPEVDHAQDQQVIVDPAPRERPPITPHAMFDPLRQVRDTLRKLGSEYERAGTPRMSGQALNVVLLGLEEMEQALIKLRELVMQSEPIDEELQRMGEQR